MPYLDISGNNQDDDFAEVYRSVVFPNDDEMRNNLYYMQLAKKIVEDDTYSFILNEPMMQMPMFDMLKAEQVRLVIRSLMFCPSIQEMKKILEKRIEYSLISAIFFINFYKLKCQGEVVSLNIAQHVTEELLRKIKLKIGDIRKTFKEYCSSSHITAAFLLMCNDNDLSRKLAVAEFLRKFGEGLRLDNRQKPLLDPETTWKVPSEYSLPLMEIMQCPNDELLAALAREYLEKDLWANKSR